MFRLMGAALLIAGSAALGLAGVGRLDGRVRDLQGLLAGVEVLQRELGWRLAPIPEALELAAGAAGGRAARFFHWCAGQSAELGGRSFRQVWEEGLDICQLRLDREDREPVEQLGAVLGRYDGDSQRQALEHTSSRLERRQFLAAEERRRMGRVYSVLGMTAGLFLVILLI